MITGIVQWTRMVLEPHSACYHMREGSGCLSWNIACLTLLHALHPAQVGFLERVQKNAGAVSPLPLPNDLTG